MARFLVSDIQRQRLEFFTTFFGTRRSVVQIHSPRPLPIGPATYNSRKKVKHLLVTNQEVGRPNPLALNQLSPNYFKQLRRFRGLIFWGGKLAGLANFQTTTILKTAGMPDGEAFGMEKVAAFARAHAANSAARMNQQLLAQVTEFSGAQFQDDRVADHPPRILGILCNGLRPL